MTSWGTAALVVAVITNGLVAGLFVAFAHAVVPGLARGGDRTFVEAMQQINVAVLNGWFGICFGGAVVSAAAAAVLHPGRPALPWTVAGLVLYLAVLAVTFAVNVPLNDALAAAGGTDPAAARARFEGTWVRWNVARAVLSTAAFGCLVGALVQRWPGHRCPVPVVAPHPRRGRPVAARSGSGDPSRAAEAPGAPVRRARRGGRGRRCPRSCRRRGPTR